MIGCLVETWCLERGIRFRPLGSWTSGRFDKLDIHRKLGVEEVWYWRNGAIQPYRLDGGHYIPIPASEVLPGLDLEQLTAFLDQPTAYDAILAYREALRRNG